MGGVRCERASQNSEFWISIYVSSMNHILPQLDYITAESDAWLATSAYWFINNFPSHKIVNPLLNYIMTKLHTIRHNLYIYVYQNGN